MGTEETLGSRLRILPTRPYFHVWKAGCSQMTIGETPWCTFPFAIAMKRGACSALNSPAASYLRMLSFWPYRAAVFPWGWL